MFFRSADVMLPSNSILLVWVVVIFEVGGCPSHSYLPPPPDHLTCGGANLSVIPILRFGH